MQCLCIAHRTLKHGILVLHNMFWQMCQQAANSLHISKLTRYPVNVIKSNLWSLHGTQRRGYNKSMLHYNLFDRFQMTHDMTFDINTTHAYILRLQGVLKIVLLLLNVTL